MDNFQSSPSGALASARGYSACASKEPEWRLPDGRPMSFAAKEPTESIRRRGWAAAAVRFPRKLADAFGYWPGLLALVGLWSLGLRPARDADRFMQAFFLLFSAAVLWFTAREGYLEARHLLPLVVVGIGAAGAGATAVGQRLANRLERGRARIFTWAIVAAMAAACLPTLLRPLHENRAAHRPAAEWLAAQGDPAEAVLDTIGWSGLYSGRRTYRYDDAPEAMADPRLAYFVLEERELAFDSQRARTLGYLVETAARRVAEFPAAAVAKPNQARVRVYRLDVQRLRKAKPQAAVAR